MQKKYLKSNHEITFKVFFSCLPIECCYCMIKLKLYINFYWLTRRASIKIAGAAAYHHCARRNLVGAYIAAEHGSATICIKIFFSHEE